MAESELEELRRELKRVKRRLDELEKTLRETGEDAGEPPWWLQHVSGLLQEYDVSSEEEAMSTNDLAAWLLSSPTTRAKAVRYYELEDPFPALRKDIAEWSATFKEGEVTEGVRIAMGDEGDKFYLD